jgi:2-dehydropantoate 2-reductase
VRSTYDAVSKSGYQIESEQFGQHTYRPERVISSASQLPSDASFDYIFVTTKATGSALPLQGYPVGASTTIVLIQNGIGVEQPYLDAYPSNTIISGVAYIAASQPDPARIVQIIASVPMSLQLGLFPAAEPESCPALVTLLQRLNAASIPSTATHNIQELRWTKLLFNGSVATTCAAMGLNTAAAMESPGGRELILGLMEEIRQTAIASGCHMTPEYVQSFFDRIDGMDMAPSMLQDCRKGIEMEVEVLCGNVWRVAEKVGVSTPRIR